MSGCASGGPIVFQGNKILTLEVMSWITMQATEVIFLRLAEGCRKIVQETRICD
jgi:hypothetical protein